MSELDDLETDLASHSPMSRGELVGIRKGFVTRNQRARSRPKWKNQLSSLRREDRKRRLNSQA